MTSSFLSTRMLLGIIFLVVMWWLPWWIVIIVWVAATLYIPRYYEGLFCIALYESWLTPTGYSWPYYTLGAGCMMVVIEIVRAGLYNRERVSHI
jgi:hypothetical protein